MKTKLLRRLRKYMYKHAKVLHVKNKTCPYIVFCDILPKKEAESYKDLSRAIRSCDNLRRWFILKIAREDYTDKIRRYDKIRRVY